MTVSHVIVILLILTCQLTPKSNSHISLPLLRLYINYSISNAIQFIHVQQCIQISTRINSSSVHTYIFVCFIRNSLRVILQGFVTQNATWCQNRGCICISSTRRTYGRIHMLPVIQTSTIILWTELFPKKRREKIQGEILQSTFEYRIQWCFHIPSRTSVFYMQSSKFPVILCYSTYRINSSTRNTTTTRLIPCRSVQGIFQWLPPCLQAFYTAE